MNITKARTKRRARPRASILQDKAVSIDRNSPFLIKPKPFLSPSVTPFKYQRFEPVIQYV